MSSHTAGRNSPAAIVLAVLAVVAVLGLALQRHEDIENRHQINEMVERVGQTGEQP